MKKQLIIARGDLPDVTGEAMERVHTLQRNNYQKMLAFTQDKEVFDKAFEFAGMVGLKENVDYEVVDDRCAVFRPMDVELIKQITSHMGLVQEYSYGKKTAH
jgi:hypothetical protein